MPGGRSEAQHAFQGNACGNGDLLRYGNAVEDLAPLEGLQHPGDVTGVDAVHGRAGADDGVETEDFVLRVLVRQALHQIDLSADGERAAGWSRGDGLGDVVRRARSIGRIDDRHGALRVHDDTDVWKAQAGGFDLADSEALVHGTETVPENDARLVQSLRVACRRAAC